MKFYSFDDIRRAGDCAAFATNHFNVTIRNGRCAAAWRGGDNPEAVSITRETWYDHKQKTGGGIIELAAQKFAGDIQQAQAFLGELHNLTPKMTTTAAPSSGHESRYDTLIAEGYAEVARYDYRDLSGAVRHFTIRLQHPERPGKKFVQGHYTDSGRVSWTLKGVDTILYRLPEIANSPYVVICEGEKSADRLAALGLPATTAPMGAGKWLASYSEALRGKDMAIFPDNDAAGNEHASLVASSLHGIASSVRIIPPQSSREKGGIDDWLDEDGGHTADDILNLIAEAPAWSPANQLVNDSDSETTPDMLAAAKQANSTPFRNYIPSKIEKQGRGGKTTEEIQKDPRTHQAMLDDLARRFLGFPRKVGEETLFDHDRDTGEIVYLHDSDRLMSWIGRRSKNPADWTRGDAMVTQRQFFASVLATCRRYESISPIPSYPRRTDVYYAHDTLPDPDPQHSRLNELLDMFLPASPEDRCLLKAMVCAPLWYIPGIPRPAWIVDSRDGQGSGKTTLVELIARLYGKAPITVARTELSMHMEVVKKRCVSRSGRDARIFLLDNVTGDFHSDELASLITSSDISGMAPYGRGEETRPNDLVYVLTANSATVSTDLADRSLYVFVCKPPPASSASADSWKERAMRHVERNRLGIVADIIHLLSTHTPFDVPTRTRFREFEQRILQPCCGNPDALASVLDHVSGSRQDSNIEEDQARAIAEVFDFELAALGLEGQPVFLRSEVVNTWGRRALNDAQGSDYKGQPVQLVRNLAKAGLLPKIDREMKRLEVAGKRERHSGVAWGVNETSESVWLVTRDAAGGIAKRMV
jgi:hypothetical protein